MLRRKKTAQVVPLYEGSSPQAAQTSTQWMLKAAKVSYQLTPDSWYFRPPALSFERCRSCGCSLTHTILRATWVGAFRRGMGPPTRCFGSPAHPHKTAQYKTKD